MSRVQRIKLIKFFCYGLLSGAFLVYTYTESANWAEFVDTLESAVLAVGGILGGLWAYLTFGNHKKQQETVAMIKALKNYLSAYQDLYSDRTLLIKELRKNQEDPNVQDYYDNEIDNLESKYVIAENSVVELLDTSIEISDHCWSKIFMLVNVYSEEKNINEIIKKVVEINNLLRKDAKVKF